MKEIIVNGNTIEYQDIGKGQPCLFIHGAFSSGHTWRKVVPKLSKHFRCIIPEWPFGGHRLPISEDLDFSPLGIADFILAILDQLQIDQITIIANDTGGAYAQVFTSKYPQKVARLILSNCEGFEIFPPPKFKSLKTMIKIPGYLWLMGKLFQYKASLKWNSTFGLLSHSLTANEVYEYYVKHFSENSLIKNDFRKFASHWHPKHTLEAAQKLSTFKNPVLILWGMDDKILFPLELGQRIHSIFKNSTLVEVPDSLTYVQEDNPNLFIEQVIHFIKKRKDKDLALNTL